MGVLGGLPLNKRIWTAKCYACQDSGAPRRVLQYLPKKEISGLRCVARHVDTAADHCSPFPAPVVCQ